MSENNANCCAFIPCSERATFQIVDSNERRPDVAGTLSCEQHVGFLLGSVPPTKPEGPWSVHHYKEPSTKTHIRCEQWWDGHADFQQMWWEIGVAYTLTLSGDWMIRVLAARVSAEGAERQKVDQVLDKIGDFHRRLWDIETEVVRKAVDIAASGGEVLIIDERLSLSSHDDPPIILVLWGELRRRGVAIELPVYADRIHLKSGGVISASDEEYARRFLFTQTLSEVLRIPLSLT